MDKKNKLGLYLAALLFLLGYMALGNYLWPPKKPSAAPNEDAVAQQQDKDKEPEKKEPAEAPAEQKPGEPKPGEPKPGEPKPGEPKPGEPKPEAPPVEPGQVEPVLLGDEGGHIEATLDPRGAGIRRLVLNHFQQADALGRPEWMDPARTVKRPLELIREDLNADLGSYLLYHFRNPTEEDFPLDTLGRRVWKRVEPEKIEAGQRVRRAVFETTVRGVRITKTYTLEPRWYHVGLEVRLELADPKAAEKDFRYMLAGAHGLRVEGTWYTSTFRNALVGRVDPKGAVLRDLQDVRQVAFRGGGDVVAAGDDTLRYAGSAVQFFASVAAVDTRDQPEQNFLAQARPILTRSAVRGRVLRKPPESEELIVAEPDGRQHSYRFASAEAASAFKDVLAAHEEVVVVSRLDIDLKGRARDIVTDVQPASATVPLFHEDMAVAVSTPQDKARVLKIKAGQPVVHKYVLYNGPVKVGLLDQLQLDEPMGELPKGAPAVDPSLVSFYRDDLRLKTLADYPSSWFGRTFNAVGLTDLVIWFTNVMHWVLWRMHIYLWLPYGLCIILLTVIVRGAMHPVSRKQALTSLRMQELAPELKKLQEKHKGDRQALSVAQMELYRKYGVNPFGSCWLIFLQMPIFLGLYFALQESIHFRLAPFLWIQNLAAPDMLIHWGQSIPWISRPQDYGWMLYLGPFFNLLPVVAVALMIVQQQMTMPPPADEQAAMQMKMMKYMMVFMGLMFYKVAAGLCIYFIASSLWGFAERKLLPKKKPGAPLLTERKPGLWDNLLGKLTDATRGDGASSSTPAPAAAGAAGVARTAIPASAEDRKKAGRDRKKGSRSSAAPASADTSALGRVRSWWADTTERIRESISHILKQAEKK